MRAVISIVSARIEDYLEATFDLETRGLEPTVTALAESLAVTKGTVVSAVKKLVAAGMLEHERYGAVGLTESGRERALKIFRRHTFVSSLFSDLLGVERDKAVHLACCMEHEMDEDTERRLVVLTQYLSRAKREGAAWFGEMQERVENCTCLPLPLAMLKPGEEGAVAKVTAEGSLKKKILEMGLVPGTPIRFVRVAPLGDPLEIQVRSLSLSLRRSEASTVWIRKEDDRNVSCCGR